MIRIVVSHGVPYIWNIDEWFALETNHRIIAPLDGVNKCTSGGRTVKALPARLSNVQAQYLISYGFASATHAPSLLHFPFQIDENLLDEYYDAKRRRMLEIYKEKRRRELDCHVETIILGKRKKGKDVQFDKEQFIDEEIRKISSTPYDMHEVDLNDKYLRDADYEYFDFPLPQTYVDRLRYKVFEDFHHKKEYYVTNGAKFGGDFLAYPGHPDFHHAEFIILCPPEEHLSNLSNPAVVSYSRLARTVKKTLLIASLSGSDELAYVTPITSVNKNE